MEEEFDYMLHFGQAIEMPELAEAGFGGFIPHGTYSAGGFLQPALIPEDIDFMSQLINNIEDKEHRQDYLYNILTDFSDILKLYNFALLAGRLLEKNLQKEQGRTRKEERNCSRLEHQNQKLSSKLREVSSRLDLTRAMSDKQREACEYLGDQLKEAEGKISTLEKENAELKAELEKREQPTNDRVKGKYTARIEAERGGLQRAERTYAMPTEIEHVYKFNTPSKGQGK